MADIEITGYGPSADLADNIGGKNARFKEGHIQTLVDGDTAINTADIASKDIATAETNGLMSATDKVTLDAVETAAKAVSNPNILINTDFRNQYLINQRGVTEMTTNIYGPDRWRTVSGSASVSAAENGATRFTSVSGSGYVAQYLENPNRFIGKTITISCKSRVSTAAQVPSLILYLAGVGQVALTRSADWNVSSGSITVPSSVSNITTAQVYWQYNGVGSWIELEWIKLEEGSVATPWQVPDPAVELARCQRYCHVYTSAAALNSLGIGIVTSARGVQIPMSFSQMRVTPTVSLTGTINVYTANSTHTPTSIGWTNASSRSGQFSLVWSADEFSSTNLPLRALLTANSKLIFDAEM